MNFKRLKSKRFIVAAVAISALAVAVPVTAFAVDGGTPHTGTPPHPVTLAVDDNGYAHACMNQFPPYEVMRGNLNDHCFAGYRPVLLATNKVPLGKDGATGAVGPVGPVGPQGPKGDTGATGPAGKDGVDAPPARYGVAMVNVDRGKGATPWGTFTTTLGSPASFGDNASGTFRMTCSAAQAPCKISVQAYATMDGVSVYPRLDIMKQSLDGGPQTYCEYADGADNDGGVQAVGTGKDNAVSVPLGIGGSLDCGSSQTRPDSGVVNDIEVPAGYYDISATFYFRH